MDGPIADRLRDLPSVDTVLNTQAAAMLLERFGRAMSTDAVRAALDDARSAVRGGAATIPGPDDVALRALDRLEREDRSGLRPLFNLTGTVLHTNLGRAVLAEAAIEAAVAAMRDPVALEYDLADGRRGERDDHVRALLCALTGAEDATLVNNNAAAVLLVLNTLANGREAVVSRGELIEIGGAFRMPDIMARAGACLVEVGTTNRTHAKDYRAALGPRTGVILKVHPSNYRIQGFTAAVDAGELAAIADAAQVPLVNDLGSGTLVDLSRWGLAKEPTVREAVAEGAGVVTFSGDKLLGGPQAGFIVGRRALIAAINANPMKRALRVDKIRLAAIEATLKLYRDPDRLSARLPTLRLLARTKAEIETQVARVLPGLARAVGAAFTVSPCACRSQIGSGALPLDTIASAGAAIRSSDGGGGVALNRLAAALRGLERPVIGRIEDGGLILDLRCLTDEAAFLTAVSALNGSGGRVIIGTAGHIDHGKTALVKALTGVDGDRLKEEKARGITIDLGFAYLPVADGPTLGFVDVPGHERFVHTMLAGASGIDFALLVVAADDGIKPQTLEHLAIIDLLGVPRGLTVLTKADLATPARLEAVAGEIRSAAAGTVLACADILAVSARTGRGIDALRDRLGEAAAGLVGQPAGARSADGGFRLAVDRVFTLAGAGLVVTGTVLAGTVRVGERVCISPSGLPARVRSLHAQNRPAELGRAGDRCALNLAGPDVSKQTVRRGDMVLAPDLHAPTDRIDAVLGLMATEAKPVGQWFPVRLHHAAAEVGARIVLLGADPLQPGGSADVQLVLDRPIAAAAADRFVVRDVSAQRTIGGGRFIDLRGPTRRRRSPERRLQREALTIAEPTAAFAALLAVPPFAWDLTVFARDRGLTAPQTDRLAEDSGLVLLLSGESRIAFASDRWRDFLTSLVERLAAFHAANPDLQGVGLERLRQQMTPLLRAPVFIAAMQMAARDGAVALDGSFVRLASHAVRLTPRDEAVWGSIAKLLDGADRFRPPRVRDMAAGLGRPEGDIRRLLKLAARMGWVDEVAQDHYFLRATVHEMAGIIGAVATGAEDGAFSAAQFRDRVLNGRKVAIQILEFFDRHGLTRRRGDLRLVNPRRLDLFAPPVLRSGAVDGGESSPVGRSDFKSEWGCQTVPGGFDSRSLPPPRSQERA